MRVCVYIGVALARLSVCAHLYVSESEGSTCIVFHKPADCAYVCAQISTFVSHDR